MIDIAIFQHEGAHARALARVGGGIGAGHLGADIGAAALRGRIGGLGSEVYSVPPSRCCFSVKARFRHSRALWLLCVRWGDARRRRNLSSPGSLRHKGRWPPAAAVELESARSTLTRGM